MRSIGRSVRNDLPHRPVSDAWSSWLATSWECVRAGPPTEMPKQRRRAGCEPLDDHRASTKSAMMFRRAQVLQIVVDLAGLVDLCLELMIDRDHSSFIDWSSSFLVS